MVAKLIMASVGVISLLAPLQDIAASQVGFVDGLWLSTESVTANEPVRIYAAIRNHSGSDISGTINFFINDDRVETRSVAALDNRVIEAWADWTPSEGTHMIQATFTDIQLESITDEAQPAPDAATLSKTITVLPPQPAQAAATSTASATTTDTPAGLERYLAPSPARSVLTYITDWSSSTRRTLAQRQNERDQSTTKEENISTTSNDATQPNTSATSTPDTRRGSDVSDTRTFFGNILDTGSKTLSNLTLALLSRPALIQLLLLVGLLYSIYRTTRFFGRRR